MRILKLTDGRRINVDAVTHYGKEDPKVLAIYFVGGERITVTAEEERLALVLLALDGAGRGDPRAVPYDAGSEGDS